MRTFFIGCLTVIVTRVGTGCASTDHSVGKHDKLTIAPDTDAGPRSGGGGGDGGASSDGGQSTTCEGPNPGGCNEDNPCPDGKVCVKNPGKSCVPSGCTCDSATNSWTCLTDCNGKVCVDAPAGTCNGVPNPAGCSEQNPCPDGKVCVKNPGKSCVSSGCTCESVSKVWTCLPDCGGDICM